MFFQCSQNIGFVAKQLCQYFFKRISFFNKWFIFVKVFLQGLKSFFLETENNFIVLLVS